ncbi:MAG: hypothetical protein WDM77_04680 [Steroidobacteraceae bacterium]
MVFAAAAGGLLGACSHSGGGSGAPLIKRHAAGTSAAGNSPADGADSGPTDLVSAVSGGGADEGPVGLKFQLGRRPVSGEPVVITLRLIANQALEHLEARFLSDEGLTLTQGAVFDPEGHMDAGSTIDHSLTLVPDHDGVYTVMATVTAGAAAEGLSRSFVIPIVVGGAALPVSAPAAKPVVARKPK